MSRNKHHLLLMRFSPPDDITDHALAEYAVAINWIKDLFPALLSPTPDNVALWDLLLHYLRDAASPDSPSLEARLPEELLMCLYGLKVVLLEHGNNWDNAMQCFAEHQKLLPPDIELEASRASVPS